MDKRLFNIISLYQVQETNIGVTSYLVEAVTLESDHNHCLSSLYIILTTAIWHDMLKGSYCNNFQINRRDLQFHKFVVES